MLIHQLKIDIALLLYLFKSSFCKIHWCILHLPFHSVSIYELLRISLAVPGQIFLEVNHSPWKRDCQLRLVNCASKGKYKKETLPQAKETSSYKMMTLPVLLYAKNWKKSPIVHSFLVPNICCMTELSRRSQYCD